MEVSADPQALEQSLRLGLRRVTVLFSDDALELGQTHAHLVGEVVSLHVELVALFHGRPQRRVPHQHGVEDGGVVVNRVVLLEDGGLLGAVDVPVVGLNITRQDLHEGRLARAVRSGQAVTITGGEGGVDVLEELASAKALGDFRYRDHRGPPERACSVARIRGARIVERGHNRKDNRAAPSRGVSAWGTLEAMSDALPEPKPATMQRAIGALRQLTTRHEVAFSERAAEDMLRRGLRLHPSEVPGALTPYDALRILCRKWLATQLPAERWSDKAVRSDVRATADAVATLLSGNQRSTLD